MLQQHVLPFIPHLLIIHNQFTRKSQVLLVAKSLKLKHTSLSIVFVVFLRAACGGGVLALVLLKVTRLSVSINRTLIN